MIEEVRSEIDLRSIENRQALSSKVSIDAHYRSEVRQDW
jgi:hypothetical protein